MFKPLIIIGAGGHGKVVLDAALKAGFTVSGFLDDVPIESEINGIKHLGMVSDVKKYAKSHSFICSIGDNSIRRDVVSFEDVEWATIIHPSVQIGIEVEIGLGTIVMATAIINISTQIGSHCIVNTGAVVEHDCIVSDFVHISPNATLCGGVNIGEKTWIGAGAIVKNDLSICENVIIGCGAVVLKDITEKGTYIGVPARRQTG
jgi:sugar O-acyltransferase (sialic acid O-acetyltransferase NeuD family)